MSTNIFVVPADLCLTSNIKQLMLDFMKSVVSSRGQITIPVAIQRKMGMGPGTPVEFELKEDHVVLRKGPPAGIDRVYGSLKLDKSVDEIIDEMRGRVPEFVRKLAAERGRGHRGR